jgi:hypothetical protein
VCLPTGTDVSAVDRVIVPVAVDSGGQPVLADGVPAGEEYQVDGTPAAYPPTAGRWQHPFSVVVQLRRTAG